MALKLTAFAALAESCSAFAPAVSSALRSYSASESGQQSKEAGGSRDEPKSKLSPVGWTAGAAALTVLAARAGRRAAAVRVARNTYRETYGPGICAPLFEKWDPLQLGTTDAKMERYTNVEIKHGRVSMIACLGYLLPEFFRFPGCENFQNGLGALSTIPPEGWAQLVAFIGAHEILVKPREGGMGPYDFGLGTELLVKASAAEVERRQTVERNNGRLAMAAIIGLMWQDGTFGVTPGAMLKSDGFWGPPVEWLVRDIGMCQGMCATKRSSRGPSLAARKAVVFEDPTPALPDERDVRMSPACPYLKYPEQLDGWVGGEKGFDPLKVTDAVPVYIVREAELKHGRVCMLATVGWIATELGARFPGEVFQKATTISAHNDAVAAGYMQPFAGFIAALELYSGFLVFAYFDNQLDRDAGDFWAGKNFLPKDEAKANDMKLKELENGRLAMVAFSGLVTQAVATGKPFPYF